MPERSTKHPGFKPPDCAYKNIIAEYEGDPIIVHDDTTEAAFNRLGVAIDRFREEVLRECERLLTAIENYAEKGRRL